MFRKFGTALLLISVLPQVCQAQAVANTPPLPPGQPAGVHQAQIMRYSGAIVIGAVVIIGVVGWLVSTKRYIVPGQAASAPSGTTG